MTYYRIIATYYKTAHNIVVYVIMYFRTLKKYVRKSKHIVKN